jgi:hypothetical protein
MLKIALYNRRGYWMVERQRCAVSANTLFISAMGNRGFEARILFDHNTADMYIRVSPPPYLLEVTSS